MECVQNQNATSDDKIVLPSTNQENNHDNKCAVCDYNFKNLSALRKHLFQFKENHLYCTVCKNFTYFGHRCKQNATKIKRNSNSDKMYTCDDCRTPFESLWALTKHLRHEHLSQGINCYICDEEFQNESALEEHSELHDPEDKVICKKCKKLFDSLKQYKIHEKEHSDSRCDFCQRQFSSEISLERHVCIWTNGKPLKCACGLVFQEYSEVIKHSQGRRPYHCCSCDHTTNNFTAFMCHIRKHTKQKAYECNICGECFALSNFLVLHRKKVHGVNKMVSEQNVVKKGRIVCPDCGKAFAEKRLEAHRETHQQQPSLCTECGKLFETRIKLSQHTLSAHSSEHVTCDICNRVLKTKKILIEHLKTHMISDSGSRMPQAVCPICGVGLAQKGSLARHILLIHERDKLANKIEEPIACQSCNAILPSKSKYYSHLRQHRAMVERYACVVCGRVFNKRQNLVRHMRLLHDPVRVIQEPSFPCKFCNKCFRERKNLQRHAKLVHKIDELLKKEETL